MDRSLKGVHLNNRLISFKVSKDLEVLYAKKQSEKTKTAELDFNHLLNVTCDKLIENTLKAEHTQLSYLSKEMQQFHRDLCKERILTLMLCPVLRNLQKADSKKTKEV